MTRTRIAIIGVRPDEVERYVAEGWTVERWKAHPHRAYSLLAWRWA